MGLRARIVAVTRETGPRSKNVLRGLARDEKQRVQFDAIFRLLLDDKELVMHGDKRGATYGPPRQRGVGTEQLILIVAVLGLLAGIGIGVRMYLRHVETTGYERGIAECNKKKLEEQAAQREREKKRDAAVLEEQTKSAAAEQRAGQADIKFEEAKREARRAGTQLAACKSTRAATADAPGAGLAGDAPAGAHRPAAVDSGGGDRTVFTWEFVRQFDGAWTDLRGEPVSDLAAGRDWPERAGAPSPYSAEDIVDVAADNAKSCSADRRQLAALMNKIERAAEAFEAQR